MGIIKQPLRVVPFHLFSSPLQSVSVKMGDHLVTLASLPLPLPLLFLLGGSVYCYAGTVKEAGRIIWRPSFVSSMLPSQATRYEAGRRDRSSLINACTWWHTLLAIKFNMALSKSTTTFFFMKLRTCFELCSLTISWNLVEFLWHIFQYFRNVFS
jgi:hypothetical protein